MNSPKPPLPALAVLSVFSSCWDDFWPGLRSRLESFFGELDFLGEPLAFTRKTYYQAEFGAPLERRLLAFAKLVEQDRLPEIKLWAHALEQEHARGGKRLFNLDPGLLTQERFVLATGKNFTHRIYLGCGIFADLTLIYQAGRWQALPWTFPDYAAPDLQAQLTALRNKYRAQLGFSLLP